MFVDCFAWFVSLGVAVAGIGARSSSVPPASAASASVLKYDHSKFGADSLKYTLSKHVKQSSNKTLSKPAVTPIKQICK